MQCVGKACLQCAGKAVRARAQEGGLAVCFQCVGVHWGDVGSTSVLWHFEK